MLVENADMKQSFRALAPRSRAMGEARTTHRTRDSSPSVEPTQTQLELLSPFAHRESHPVAHSVGRILRLPQVCDLIGLKKTMIYQLEAGGRFPGRVKVGARAVGWLEEELRAWLAERAAARHDRTRT